MNKTTTQQKEKVNQAYEAGYKAFVRGNDAIPANDPMLRPILKGTKVGQGMPILKSWIRGYLAAPVEAQN